MIRTAACSREPPGALGIACRAALLAFYLGPLASPALAQKTDVVHMNGGNVLVGEVKKMRLGLLEFKVDQAAGNLRIKWEQVVRLTSDKQLDVEIGDGRRYLGTLVESSGDGELRIRTSAGEVDVKLAEVVDIEPIESSFWGRLDADIAAGLSFTKATDILQINLGGSAAYRRPEAWTELRVNSIITSKSGEESSTNSDLVVSHLRFFKHKWFYTGGVGATRNDELGIDFRGSLSGGLGRRVVHSNRALFLLALLLSGNQEATSDDLTTNNLEVALRTKLAAFRYDSPKLDLDANLGVFVNLTSWGRYRVNFDGRISLEMVTDLFWDIGQVYYRFDSDPSLTTDSTADYGIVTGLRYEF